MTNSSLRLFAIVVTSIVFGVRITMVSGLSGFLSYTRFKVERLKQTRPLSSLLRYRTYHTVIMVNNVIIQFN